MKEYKRKWREDNKEKNKEYQRKDKLKHKERRRLEQKRYTNKYPEKVKAQQLAKRKILLKDSCQICNSKMRLERHHPDYSKPLLTMTVCKDCHCKIHKGGQF